MWLVCTVADHSPSSHQTEEVLRKGLLATVPEGIHKDLVVLDGNGDDGCIQLKGTLLEHDDVLVVDARPFREYHQRRV